MFTVSGENTVKCLKGSSDIFGNGRTSSLVFGNLRQSSGIFGSLRKTSEIVRNCLWNCQKSLDLYTKQNNSGLFGAVFVSFQKKFTVSKNFLLLVLKCLKFNCFMLQRQKMKCWVLSRYPHSHPQLPQCQNKEDQNLENWKGWQCLGKSRFILISSRLLRTVLKLLPWKISY